MTGRGEQWFDASLASCPVMGVFRGLSPRETVARATAAWDLGVVNVEVPIESVEALSSLRAAIDAGRERGQRIGAGTVTTIERLRAAHDAGAAYVVSPGLDPVLVEAAREAQLPVLAGVATASEILQAHAWELDWLKAFPASVLGPAWIAAMRGPFPTLKLVVTGGVDGHNAAEFLAAGASVVGVGSAFADPAQCEQLAVIIAEHHRPGHRG